MGEDSRDIPHLVGTDENATQHSVSKKYDGSKWWIPTENIPPW